jgi:hypothetical protein
VKYGVVYIQVYADGIVRVLFPLLLICNDIKIWCLLLNEDSEAFVVFIT